MNLPYFKNSFICRWQFGVFLVFGCYQLTSFEQFFTLREHIFISFEQIFRSRVVESYIKYVINQTIF